MFIFIFSPCLIPASGIKNLHSTMFIFIYVRRIGKIEESYYLHSTMFIFIYEYETLIYDTPVFTFHYVYIYIRKSVGNT